MSLTMLGVHQPCRSDTKGTFDEAARTVIDSNMTYQNIPKIDYKFTLRKKTQK